MSYTSSFLVLCLTPYVADITFITLLLSQMFARLLTDCLMCPVENDNISQQKHQHIFKIYVVNITKLIFKFILCQVCFKLSKY